MIPIHKEDSKATILSTSISDARLIGTVRVTNYSRYNQGPSKKVMQYPIVNKNGARNCRFGRITQQLRDDVLIKSK